MPTCIRDCILVPIPKGQKDASRSDNYRSIALAPSISKILEWVILSQYSDAFVTSDLQFGFKRVMSTSLCTGFISVLSLDICKMILLFMAAFWTQVKHLT